MVGNLVWACSFHYVCEFCVWSCYVSPAQFSNYLIEEERYETRHVFPQCGILTSVNSDEPVQLYFKLRNSK